MPLPFISIWTMQNLYDTIVSNIIDSLTKDAERILQECVNERTYEHDHFNLYDSYGFGIYLKGKLIKSGFLGTEKSNKMAKWYGREIYGREEIVDFLKNAYVPQGGIDMAIAAAMPYAKVLEEGGGGIKKQYKVISMSFEKLNAIKNKYQATVKQLK